MNKTVATFFYAETEVKCTRCWPMGQSLNRALASGVFLHQTAAGCISPPVASFSRSLLATLCLSISSRGARKHQLLLLLKRGIVFQYQSLSHVEKCGPYCAKSTLLSFDLSNVVSAQKYLGLCVIQAYLSYPSRCPSELKTLLMFQGRSTGPNKTEQTYLCFCMTSLQNLQNTNQDYSTLHD